MERSGWFSILESDDGAVDTEELRKLRDSAATKRRLLAAAVEKCAERGAGVDRVATAAQADSFGDTDGLFDAAAGATIDHIIDSVRIAANRLASGDREFRHQNLEAGWDNPDRDASD